MVTEELKPLPISDQVIKDYNGKIVDCVYLRKFAFGKETPLHQIELKAKKPFKSPVLFEENMQEGVIFLSELLSKKYNAYLLGTGMHPTIQRNDTSYWPHGDQNNYNDFKKLFDFKRQGWFNTQSFHLNLPYSTQKEAVILYNTLSHLCAYLPAISASSPIIEGKVQANVDNRLHHYKDKMKEIPSITGDIIPEYITSINQFQKTVIDKLSIDLASAGANKKMLHTGWVDQRGVIFKSSREALELRVMDEQECIKSDVALSCFVRATVRGLIEENAELPQHQILVDDYNEIVKNGLAAMVRHPHGGTAKEVCQYFFNIALEYADGDEKKYLWIVKKRIEEGNLSELIQNRVLAESPKNHL